MNQAEFLQQVHGHMAMSVEDGQLGLAGYIWALEDKDGKEGICIYACDLEPHQAWELAITRCAFPETKQLVFVLDRWGKPDQGTMGDLLAGIYYERGAPQPIRPFIVEYGGVLRRAQWFNWANPFWVKAIKHEMAGTIAQLREKLAGAPE